MTEVMVRLPSAIWSQSGQRVNLAGEPDGRFAGRDTGPLQADVDFDEYPCGDAPAVGRFTQSVKPICSLRHRRCIDSTHGG